MPASAHRWLLLAAALSLFACRDDRRPAGVTSASAAPSGSATVTRPPPPPPSAEELALLAPLAKGSDIEGYEVRDIRGVEDGVLRLVCVKDRDRATIRLDVALLDEEGPTPPATAGKYAIYYSLRGAVPEDAEKLARRLAKVLQDHASMPPPKGMTKFVPREKPGTTL